MFSLHGLVVLATWAIGVLGVGGVIAIVAVGILFGPTVAIGIVQPIVRRFLDCGLCIAIATILLVAIGSYWMGHHQAVKECRADELEAKLRNERVDAQAARDAKADEARRADAIEREAKEQHDRDQAYIDQLKSNPICAFDDSDIGASAGRLRQRARPGRTQPSAGAR